MSFQKSLNPGNINVRLGVLLARREVAVESGDLEALANIDGGIEDYLSVFMTDKEWASFQTMPGYVEGDNRDRLQVSEDMRSRHRAMLKVARENNVFARGEAEVGDASSLDDIIEEGREEATP